MISAIVAVFRSILSIFRVFIVFVPFFVKIPRFLSYIVRFLKGIATKPGGWLLLPLLQLADQILYVLTGFSIGIAVSLNWIVHWVVGLLMQSISKQFFNMNFTELYNQLPSTVLEVLCYSGFTEALQLLFNSIATAIGVLLGLKISVLIVKAKIHFFGVKMTRM